jgi:hypothetical protein
MGTGVAVCWDGEAMLLYPLELGLCLNLRIGEGRVSLDFGGWS